MTAIAVYILSILLGMKCFNPFFYIVPDFAVFVSHDTSVHIGMDDTRLFIIPRDFISISTTSEKALC